MFIFFIIAGFAAFMIWSVNNESQKEAERLAAVKKHADDNRFRIRLRSDFITLDDGSKIECLLIESAGIINAPCDNCSVHHSLRLSEKVQGGESKPIFCNLEIWRDNEDHTAFFFSNPYDIPHKSTLINDWIRLGAVPFDRLIFSKRGHITIECTATFLSANNYKTLVQAIAKFKYKNTALGYIDGAESRVKTQVATVQMAVLISGCEGDHGKAEGQVIKDWINDQISKTPKGGERDALKTRLNDAIKSVFHITGLNQVRDMLRELSEIVVENTETAGRYMVMELLMKVARADGTATNSELKLIDEVGRQIGLDKDKARALRDKILPVTIHEKASSNTSPTGEDSLLGLDPSMDPQEKLKKLNQEYRKWNSRTEHADPEIRKQAREMVALIARARQRYKLVKV
jgi:hypothetical protein